MLMLKILGSHSHSMVRQSLLRYLLEKDVVLYNLQTGKFSPSQIFAYTEITLLLISMCILIILIHLTRNNAEEALQKLNGTTIGKQTVRLSWGRNPANKPVISLPFTYRETCILVAMLSSGLLIYRNKCLLMTNNIESTDAIYDTDIHTIKKQKECIALLDTNTERWQFLCYNA